MVEHHSGCKDFSILFQVVEIGSAIEPFISLLLAWKI